MLAESKVTGESALTLLLLWPPVPQLAACSHLLSTSPGRALSILLLLQEPCSPKPAWHRLPAALTAPLASCSSHGQVWCRDEPSHAVCHVPRVACHTDGLPACSGGCCLLITAETVTLHDIPRRPTRREGSSPLSWPWAQCCRSGGSWSLCHLHVVPHGDLTGLHAAFPEHKTHSAWRESTISLTVCGTPCVVFGM